MIFLSDMCKIRARVIILPLLTGRPRKYHTILPGGAVITSIKEEGQKGSRQKVSSSTRFYVKFARKLS